MGVALEPPGQEDPTFKVRDRPEDRLRTRPSWRTGELHPRIIVDRMMREVPVSGVRRPVMAQEPSGSGWRRKPVHCQVGGAASVHHGSSSEQRSRRQGATGFINDIKGRRGAGYI